MPYVEGFGTYPFGEEWLFDAVIRSYLPVLEVAERLTMTVTPVLADQLEDAGVRERLRRFLVEWRIGAAEADLAEVAAGVPRRLRGASWRATGARWSCSTRPAATRCAPSSGRRAEGRIALAASAATHAVLPLLATRAGPAAAARRRDPLAPAPLRLGRRLLAARVRLRAGARVAAGRAGRAAGSASTRAPTRRRCDGAGAGRAPRPGRWRCRSTGRRSSWLWSLDGYPSDPAHAQFAGKSLRGMRIWKVGGGAYDPAAAAAAARRQAGEFLAAVAARLRAYAAGARPPRPARLRDRHRAARPLVVGGADLAARGPRRAPRRPACACSPCREALAEHEPVERPLRASTWGEGKDLRTWDSPPVADLAWGARRLELRLLRALSQRACAATPPQRAARELLAAQASDWAFLDQRGQAGDYAYQRATDHAAGAAGGHRLRPSPPTRACAPSPRT